MSPTFIQLISPNSTAIISKRCIHCPEAPPDCPICPGSLTCELISSTCEECASTICTDRIYYEYHNNAGDPYPGGPAKRNKIIIGVCIPAVVFIGALLFWLCWRCSNGKKASKRPSAKSPAPSSEYKSELEGTGKRMAELDQHGIQEVEEQDRAVEMEHAQRIIELEPSHRRVICELDAPHGKSELVETVKAIGVPTKLKNGEK
ncbi:MAG: hypothetical protein M1820_001496 [Bogoriella megaspora]|nr:MAG: hypothetical protein M1820_001496 [Bogoriella megaspora]